jgi:hypothetical protein
MALPKNYCQTFFNNEKTKLQPEDAVDIHECWFVVKMNLAEKVLRKTKTWSYVKNTDFSGDMMKLKNDKEYKILRQGFRDEGYMINSDSFKFIMICMSYILKHGIEKLFENYEEVFPHYSSIELI